MKNIKKAALIGMILGLMFVLISCSNTNKREPYNEDIHPALSVQNSLSRAQDNTLNHVQKFKIDNSILLKNQHDSIDEFEAQSKFYKGLMAVSIIILLYMIWSMYNPKTKFSKLCNWIVTREQEKESKKEREIALIKITPQEEKQKKYAHIEGLEKYHQMDVDDAKDYQKGIDAARELGIILQKSVYQEKEKDWALLGGIANGIAGPGAGISTAVNAMQENERIRAENAKRRQQGAEMNAFYQDLAFRAAQKKPVARTMEQLDKEYDAIMSWSPKTLFSRIIIKSKTAISDWKSGAVNVSVEWEQKNKSLCIDGALRAKIYAENKCVGCAYLVLPKEGTAKLSGKISGVCARPQIEASDYSVEIEPVDLWELAPKGKKSKTDNLTLEKHREIVAKYEKDFQDELAWENSLNQKR